MKEPKKILFNVHYVSDKDNKECEFPIYFTLDETFDAEKVYSTATSFMHANGLQGYPIQAVPSVDWVATFTFPKPKEAPKEENVKERIKLYDHVYRVTIYKDINEGTARKGSVFDMVITGTRELPSVYEIVQQINKEMVNHVEIEDLDGWKIKDFTHITDQPTLIPVPPFIPKLVWARVKGVVPGNQYISYWIPAYTREDGTLESVLGELSSPDSEDDTRPFTKCPFEEYRISFTEG
jgi:hypothetical protein